MIESSLITPSHYVLRSPLALYHPPGYPQAPFACTDNANNRDGERSRSNVSLAGKISIHVKALTTSKRIFFVIVFLAVVAITTKAMQSAAASNLSTSKNTVKVRCVPDLFGPQHDNVPTHTPLTYKPFAATFMKTIDSCTPSVK